jgi:protein-S-isoprenylcysteine O-methyltransferase Ste14
LVSATASEQGALAKNTDNRDRRVRCHIGRLAITIWARVVLGGNWSGNITFKENHELIEHGPYRYVRHPIYSGLCLMVLGSTTILSGRVAGLIPPIIFFLGFWSKARREEKLLTKHFPDTYPDYKARVKAFIPFLF